VKFTVNGEERAVEVAPLKRLLDVLRDDLGLTGAKEGCGEGECGACSVLVTYAPPFGLRPSPAEPAPPGELVDSCLVPICQVEGAQVLTVEGITPSGQLTPLQRAFVERGGAQCGICTPGMVVAAHCFLASGQPATDQAVREAIAGNLCRCTGYAKIVEAIQGSAGGAGSAGDGPNPKGGALEATRR
jgi:carbon-monoxide dehydrogenase small subunit